MKDMLEKMKLETQSGVVKNIEIIGKLFPCCLDEGKNAEGKTVRTVNFERLRQMLSDEYESGSESYEFTWPGKQKAAAEAYRPTDMTLRPDKEKSITFAGELSWKDQDDLY